MKPEIKRQLKKLYNSEGTERVGLILDDGEVVELENKASEPEENFLVSPLDLIKYSEKAVASWHTHPNDDNNLSSQDYLGFVSWPHLTHYIIGSNGVKEYFVNNDGLILERS